MKIIGEFAARLGVPTPLFNASAAIYNAAMAQGYAQAGHRARCARCSSRWRGYAASGIRGQVPQLVFAYAQTSCAPDPEFTLA